MEQIYQHINQYFNQNNPIYIDIIKLRQLELEVEKLRLQLELRRLETSTTAPLAPAPGQTPNPPMGKPITSAEKTQKATEWVDKNEPAKEERHSDYYNRYERQVDKNYHVSDLELECIAVDSYDKYTLLTPQNNTWYRIW
jgi:hypothetical protein